MIFLFKPLEENNIAIHPKERVDLSAGLHGQVRLLQVQRSNLERIKLAVESNFLFATKLEIELQVILEVFTDPWKIVQYFDACILELAAGTYARHLEELGRTN